MSHLPSQSHPVVPDGGLQTGRVKCFYADKRYGFLTSDLMSEDVFFHQSNTLGIDPASLVPGLRVYFRVRLRAKGYKAYSIGISRYSQVISEFRESRSLSEHRPTHLWSSQHHLEAGQIEDIPHASLFVRPRVRRLRCYNCGQYASHKAANCPYEHLTKCCYRCRDPTHLLADCPFQITESQTERVYPPQHLLQQQQQQQQQQQLRQLAHPQPHHLHAELPPYELQHCQEQRPPISYPQHQYQQPTSQLPMAGPSTSQFLFPRFQPDRNRASDRKHESVLHFLRDPSAST